jgi:hypothetical protein
VLYVIMELTTLLAGPIGGFLGILGNVANTLLSMKQQKQQNEFELARIPLQLNADIEMAKAKVAVVAEQTAGEGFIKSQDAGKVTGKESRWVLNIQAMVRPTILFLLGVGSVAIYTSGNPTQDMKDYITQNIVTDFSMAVSWYFGARASAKVMQGFKTKAGS